MFKYFKKRLLRLSNSFLKRFIGYRLYKIEKFNFSINFPEASLSEIKLMNMCSKYSMTGYDRLFFLIKAINYVRLNNVSGDFVECGVWKGGNLILFQKMISKFNLKKKIYAFDTFEGMTQPLEIDRMLNNGPWAKDLMIQELKDKNKTNIHCYSPLNEVMNNFKKNTLNKKNLICIKGPVERTLVINNNLPKKISILRLDTDFYESTKIELEVLFPLLENNGILIIDDYGCWQGAKKAVDEYFLNKKFTMFKIDITGRFIIKNNL
jgi:hypothetical protein